MIPLVVVILALLVFRSLGALGMPVFSTWQACTPFALALLFWVTASARLTSMREDLVKMVPPFIPFPRLMVYLTGGFEVLGAIGLLIPATRSAAGFCLAALLVVVFPANLHAALKQIPLRGKRPTPLWARLPMQLIYIGLAVWAAL